DGQRRRRVHGDRPHARHVRHEEEEAAAVNGMISFLQQGAAGASSVYIYLYLIATVAFIRGIKRLGRVQTARSGNQLAAAGMLVAIVTAIVETQQVHWTFIVIGLVVGGAIGLVLAARVQMTAMPELVAAFNGLVGAASMFVGLAFLATEDIADMA